MRAAAAPRVLDSPPIATAPLVRPEFGPTLPALLRGRFGVPERATVAAVVALAALAGAAAVLLSGEDREQLTHRGTPAFTLLYTPDLVAPAEPVGGELARVAGRAGGAQASVAVRPLADGELSFGGLPVYAEAHIESLRAAHPGLVLVREGKARIWGQPGYRVEFRAGDLRGNDALIFPDDTGLRGGVLVSLRREGGGAGPSATELADEVRRVQRSFQFGTARK